MKGTFSIRREVRIDYRDFISTLLADGLDSLGSYGFSVSFDEGDYKEAKIKLKESGVDSISFEDVLTQIILDEKPINFIDEEGEHSTELTVWKFQSALHKLLNEEPDEVFIFFFDVFMNKDYDAEHCDVLLQYILFDEHIFG
jgi:hypothetical protein